MAGAAAPALAEDAPNSEDHPLVGRYEGSTIGFYQQVGYEETLMPREAFPRGKKEIADHSVAVSGKLTSIMYDGPGGRSALEVVRNYQQSLTDGGFATVFECRKDACGHPSDFYMAAKAEVKGVSLQWASTVYVLMSLERPEGRVWVSVIGIEVPPRGDKPLTPQVAIRVMEEKPIETGKITLVKASDIEKAIDAAGRVALYGVEFDFDSANVKSSSDAQIAEIAGYLKANADVGALVVGHTDATGKFDYNRDLSERRAAAVVAKLTDEHGIAAERLFAVGVGPAAPTATNRTEEGRARNRRVEIVELPKL